MVLRKLKRDYFKDGMMVLDEGDKNTCKEIAREIVKEVLVEHTKLCPHGLELTAIKAKFIGICIGVGIGSGIGSTGVCMMLLRIFGG